MHEIYEQFLIYARLTWKRRRYALGVAWGVCLLAWMSVIMLPDSYTSTARVYVDTSNMLRPLLKGLTVEPDIQSELIIMQRTLTSRPNIQRIARMTDLDITATTPEALELLFNDLERRMSIARARGANLFSVSFLDSNPKRARDVVQALLTIFIESNLGQGRKDMDDARRFIDQQIQEYEALLEQGEQRLARFKQENAQYLSGGGQADYRDRLSKTQAGRAALEADLRDGNILRQTIIDALKDIPKTIQSSAAMGMGSGPPSNVESRILELEEQLDQLLTVYTENHPDVASLRRHLAAVRKKREEEMEATINAIDERGEAAPDQLFGEINPVYEQTKLRLLEVESNIAITEARVDEIEKTLDRLNKLQYQVPQVEAELSKLNRDYNILKTRYEGFLSRRESAKIARERDKRSESVQFRVVEPPQIPSLPSGPPRSLFLTVILIGGLAAGIAFAWLLGQLNDTFLDATRLRKSFAIPVIGTISTVSSSKSAGWKRIQSSTFYLALLGLIGVYVILTVLEFKYGFPSIFDSDRVVGMNSRFMDLVGGVAKSIQTFLTNKLDAF